MDSQRNTSENSILYNFLKKIKLLRELRRFVKNLFLKEVILHGDVIGQRVFLETIKEINPSSIIETGTYFGWTTEFLAKRFPDTPIYTCEIDALHYKKSKKRLSKYPNVRIYFGSSPDFLKLLINKNLLGDKPFFYLDAHWGEEWPLKQELRIISETLKSAVYAIDDFKVPNDNRFIFDSYKNEECSVEIVKSNLSKKMKYNILFPNYGEENAFKKGVTHASSLIGYIFIFQNLQKGFSNLMKKEFFKRFFKSYKL